ncbi:hypothetical protein E2C01_023882 [Portunus trituberculatus]|uniref:Uncharacterized protein n=1 Tax=Portunus trituberculatus TaxID=210409 RepID=A0A5B7EB93_PORTR|nr:hypothetical protein [Portunus trituberculatus]
MDMKSFQVSALLDLAIRLCASFGFLEFLLGLAELSQVEGGDLLSLLDLPLVGLDLLLKSIDKVLHPFVVLLVLVGLESSSGRRSGGGTRHPVETRVRGYGSPAWPQPSSCS